MCDLSSETHTLRYSSIYSDKDLLASIIVLTFIQHVSFFFTKVILYWKEDSQNQTFLFFFGFFNQKFLASFSIYLLTALTATQN